MLETRLNLCQDADERKDLAATIIARDEGKLIECLDDGFIRLVQTMGTDADVVQAARVSYGAGTRTALDDRALIRYLMRHRHSTPFEMVEAKFHVRVPMDTWRQWIRHRTANVNEYSTRYSLAIDSQQKTGEEDWRSQAKSNKQGSQGWVTDWPENVPKSLVERTGCYTPGEALTEREEELHDLSRLVYQERIELGVAREQARKDLPLSTYTEAYWKCDLHNILNFLSLRMDGHAQYEIRQYANAMYELLKPILPVTMEAFRDYRLHAMYLSGPEIDLLKRLLADPSICGSLAKSERAEFDKKMDRLGLAFGAVPSAN